MARDRKYFYPQVVLTCQDKILKELLEENMSEDGGSNSDYKISSLNNSINKGEEAKSDIKMDASFVKDRTVDKKKILSESIRERFN